MAVDLHRLVSPTQWPITPYPEGGALHALLSNGSSDWSFWDAGVYERHPLHTTGEPLRFSHIFRAHVLDDVVAEGQAIIVDGDASGADEERSRPGVDEERFVWIIFGMHASF